MKNNRLLMLALIMAVTVVAFASCGADRNYKQDVPTEAVIEERMPYGGIEEYEVQAFDTLSKIAVKYIPSDKYMADWINDVQKLNGRDNSTIYYGETIKVYSYE